MCSVNNPCLVLFVEDEESIIKVVQIHAARYKNLGIEFVFARSVADARQQIVENEIVIAVIDLGLNDSRGLNTLKSIIELTEEKRTPIYVHTGFFDESLRQELLAQGAREVFYKSDISLFNMVVFAHHAANEERTKQRLRSERNFLKRKSNELEEKCQALEEEFEQIKQTVPVTARFDEVGRKLIELRESVKRMAATH